MGISTHMTLNRLNLIYYHQISQTNNYLSNY